MASREQKIPSLDGLRAVSIALVVIAHCADTPHAYTLRLFEYTGELGLLGVKIFFVISGFLITSLLLRERTANGSISLPRFYIRRILRIFPAFYTFLLIVFFLSRAGVFPIPLRDFLHAATFTANGFGISWELLHVWSLSVEEQFYLIWPLSLLLLGVKLPLRGAAILVLIAPLFFGFVLHEHVRLGEAVSSLAAGCVLAGLRWHRVAQGSYLLLLAKTWTPLVLALSILLLETTRRFWFYQLLAPVVSILIAVLVDCLVTFASSPVGRFLNKKIVADVGVLSYSLYLWQQIFLDKWGTYWFNVFPVNVVCAVACALLSYYLVERPFLRWKARWKGGGHLPDATVSGGQAQIA